MPDSSKAPVMASGKTAGCQLTSPGSRFRTPILATALVVFTLAAFNRVKDCGFINYDDGAYVARNTHVLTGFTGDNVKWAFTTFQGANYNPVTWLSLQLDAQCLGPGPLGFHLTNLILHALNAALLLVALHAMTGSIWRAAASRGFSRFIRCASKAWRGSANARMFSVRPWAC